MIVQRPVWCFIILSYIFFQVTVGNLTFLVGHLLYEEPEVLSQEVIIAIAVGGGLLLFVLIAVCIVYRIKSRRNDDKMKKMRIQMDMLEARVANECKEGECHGDAYIVHSLEKKVWDKIGLTGVETCKYLKILCFIEQESPEKICSLCFVAEWKSMHVRLGVCNSNLALLFTSLNFFFFLSKTMIILLLTENVLSESVGIFSYLG